MKPASFVIPTFKEKEKIEALIHCFENIRNKWIEIIIVNGNPDDDTSQWLKSCGDKRILELTGHPSLYWSGLVNVGLGYILNSPVKPDYVFVMNADILFSTDILQAFLSEAQKLKPCQLAAVTSAHGRVLSSGVRVQSWFFTLNCHPLAGSELNTLPDNQLIPVDFLPTRCIMFPFEALQKAGLTAEKRLPHYCGDYEFTARLSRLGYKAYIATNIVIEVDTHHTGADVYSKKLNLWTRISSVFSIKSPSNPFYQIRFINLVYPRWSRPSAILLYVIRCLLEVLLGGNRIKKIFYHTESGFSGR
jgi:GT2 family glycosyltransferase